MKITVHDGRVFEKPDGSLLHRLLFELRDAGDFIVLRDDKLDEIRAAGPVNNQFLVQCDLLSDAGTFEGERVNVTIAQVQSMFLAFLNRDVSWKSTMSSTTPTLSEAMRSPLAILLLVGISLVLYVIIKKVTP
jgi:hypothetical protein